jgi:hypothetical protein
VTECAQSSDCVLRDGTECCPGCDGVGIVSVNRTDALEALVCGQNTTCNACISPIPTGYVPDCQLLGTTGRCTISQTP